jgi:hypothetical protein
MASSGFQFAVIESVNGGLGNTANIASCIHGASSAGYYVSVYGFFCPNCRGQTDGYSAGYNAVTYLTSQGIYPYVNFTYFYVDVEECDPSDDCWQEPNYNANKQYLLNVVRGIQDAGASAGIYSSYYEWNLVFGSASWSDPALTALPLWYANWNGKADMSGFTPFGGWTSPHMHQYADSCSSCCQSLVDLDFIY